jgi:hypothetical protein
VVGTDLFGRCTHGRVSIEGDRRRAYALLDAVTGPPLLAADPRSVD